MSDLIAKLRAALDEDERVARRDLEFYTIVVKIAAKHRADGIQRAEHMLAIVAAMRKVLDWLGEHHCDSGRHIWSPADPDDVAQALAEAYGIEP